MKTQPKENQSALPLSDKTIEESDFYSAIDENSDQNSNEKLQP